MTLPIHPAPDVQRGVNLPSQPDIDLRRVEDCVRKRSSTDRRMGNAWMIVPILPIAAGIFLAITLIGIVLSTLPRFQAGNALSQAQVVTGFFAFYGFALLTFYVILLIGAFATFYFLDRRNRHFKRQQLLFAAISSHLSSKNSIAGENVGKLNEVVDDSLLEEHDRPAGLWAVLYVFVTPVVGLVVAYNLTQDLRKHEERQLAYQTTLASALEQSDFPRPSFSVSRKHNRDPMVYLILTAITAGLFWIYWFYTILRDYNEHFEDQAVLEDQIVASLKPSITCSSCGGSVPHGAKFCPLCGSPQTART